MASSLPLVLVLGHSFNRRLWEDLSSHFDSWADDTFGLLDDTTVHLHGFGDLTVARLRRDLGIVSSLSPEIVLLELGTNYLARFCPEVAGSETEELVCLLLDTFSVWVISVCEALPSVKAPFFNGVTSILNQYICGVLSPFLMSFVGIIEVLATTPPPYLPDGVHVNILCIAATEAPF